MDKKKLALGELILFGILGALVFAMKVVMAALPNIEPVSLCLLVFGAIFGWKALYPCYVYVVLEILCFGLGTWNICYLYVWAIPVMLGMVLRGMQDKLGWALVSGVYGLLFGGLCAIVDAFIGCWAYAISKLAAGIPFDISHCVGNFCIALVLFLPLRQLLARLYGKMRK